MDKFDEHAPACVELIQLVGKAEAEKFVYDTYKLASKGKKDAAKPAQLGGKAGFGKGRPNHRPGRGWRPRGGEPFF